jgi:glycosyltransferase involved in cell wall biosynthesis
MHSLQLYQRIKATLEKQEKMWGLVLVNDSSTDGTTGILDGIYERDPRVTVVQLRRNYGQTAALMAGFDHARGEVVVAMDGDLQHAPEEIPIQDSGALFAQIPLWTLPNVSGQEHGPLALLAGGMTSASHHCIVTQVILP